ncbi:hypothetical protein K458DRAFT_483420 [Lentithecium fluviatile CBS 122367]|uniref:Uncharacterized protein n=1 Tax=Lentithecium fluviatile CBS 122367 TaxID=1168545 RepID=A0A6G1JI55_9PLEO|nr:hypothetical protein K458DRAFT_483420 [Lentithecium fluviatile CBS 122367]
MKAWRNTLILWLCPLWTEVAPMSSPWTGFSWRSTASGLHSRRRLSTWPQPMRTLITGGKCAMNYNILDGVGTARLSGCSNSQGVKRVSFEDGNRSPRIVDNDILLFSKLVRKEALAACWVGTFKLFGSKYILEHVLVCPNLPNYNWLARVRLDFSIHHYLDFITVRERDGRAFLETKSRGYLLKSVSTIKELVLNSKKPYRSSNIHNSWIYGKPEPLCFKIAVNCILLYYFPFVKHIPTIRLTGYIKTSVKAKWNYILSKEYAERALACPTRGYD